jgi:hypothetical protein
MEMNSGSLKSTARFAGLLYLVWIVTGLYSIYYVPSQIHTNGDAAAAAQSILSNEFLFRATILTDLLSSALWIFLVLVLYRLLKPVDLLQARLLVALVIVQIPIVFTMGAFNITALMIVKGEILRTFEIVQRQDLALLFLRVNDYGVLGLEFFWGLWLVPLSVLVYRSRFLPRFLGVWLMIDAFALVVLCFTSLLFPQSKDVVYKIAFPAMLGEVAFMLWLLIKGAKPQAANGWPGE